MISKSEVSFCAVWRAVITRLAIVPLSLYAGKKMVSPTGGVPGRSVMDSHKLACLPRYPARSQNQPPRRHERLDEHLRRDLRRALTTLHEDDRHLADPAAEASRFEEHLGQE